MCGLDCLHNESVIKGRAQYLCLLIITMDCETCLKETTVKFVIECVQVFSVFVPDVSNSCKIGVAGCRKTAL